MKRIKRYICALVAGAIIVVQFISDDRIRTSENLEKYLGIAPLGMMPVTKGNEASKSRKTKKSKKGGSKA